MTGDEQIFRKLENYHYFLRQASRYLLPYVEIYAYVLMPQRFQLLLCFKPKGQILKFLKLEDRDFSEAEEHRFLMQPFSNMLNSYAKAYNKMFQREGSLFMDYLKRMQVESKEQILSVMRTIHLLPVVERQVVSPFDWNFSSYSAYLNLEKHSQLSRRFLLDFFENLNHFQIYHEPNKTS